MEKIENEVNLYLFTSLSHQSLSKQKQIMITNIESRTTTSQQVVSLTFTLRFAYLISIINCDVRSTISLFVNP